jgi:hypothetical protein
MSVKDLSRDPQNIDERNWYYEEKDGIEVIHKTFDKSGFPYSDHIKIPWRMIKKSIRRLEEK